jgi:restriction system protein
MPIPDFQSCFRPMLALLSQHGEMPNRDAAIALADQFQLTEEERRQLLPSGRQTVFHNRIGWARTYLKKAGLLSTPRRGVVDITGEGRKVLARAPALLNVRYLKDNYPAFRAFHEMSRAEGDGNGGEEPSGTAGVQNVDLVTPEERLEQSFARLRSELADELLERVQAGTWEFFEQLVVRLMVAMGYGGSLKDAGQAIGRSGDEGIDGVIKEDRLGLDVIFLQAKKWSNPVGRPEVQKFVGALHGKQARKGVFITTSNFTKEAEEYARMVETKLILINGKRLADLMVDFNVGVTTVATYDVKKVDSDFFGDE